jgi:hypothetical protein
MPITMVGQTGRGAGRLSPKCALYWVRTVLGWMTDQGMARQEGAPGAEGSWMLTERFRIQVRDMAAEPAYRLLAALGRGENPTAGHPRTPVSASPDRDGTQDAGHAAPPPTDTEERPLTEPEEPPLTEPEEPPLTEPEEPPLTEPEDRGDDAGDAR